MMSQALEKPVQKREKAGAKVTVLARAVSDEEILEGLQFDEPRAAAALYDRFAPEVNRTVWRLLGADSDHDDLVQQVFCHLLTSARKVREADRLQAFVLRVTVNTVRSELRKRSVRRRFMRIEEDPDRFESVSSDPEVRAELARTFSILNRLPTQERLAFCLRLIDGRSLEEVATLSGCSLATVKRRIAKAQKRFRAMARTDRGSAAAADGSGGAS